MPIYETEMLLPLLDEHQYELLIEKVREVACPYLTVRIEAPSLTQACELIADVNLELAASQIEKLPMPRYTRKPA